MSLDHGRFDYSAIVDRPRLRLPGGARLAVWIVPNLEHFPFLEGGPSLVASTAHLRPDVCNFAWRDYGNRVGFWRVLEVMDRHNLRATAALNSAVCEYYPRIVEACRERRWDYMGHGVTNSRRLSDMTEAEEQANIKATLDQIEASAGVRPAGWLSPALSESLHTVDLLQEAGLAYLCDWGNDDQPYVMTARGGEILSVPYSPEINDLPLLLSRGLPSEVWARTVCDAFDVLYAEGETSARVMAVPLHPFLAGAPHHISSLDRIFSHLRSHPEVWFCTGREIAQHYLAQRAPNTQPPPGPL